MERWTRRGFIKGTVQAAAGTAALGTSCGPREVTSKGGRPDSGECGHEVVALSGTWLFRTDPDKRGESSGWHGSGVAGEGWEEVSVPSTWGPDTFRKFKGNQFEEIAANGLEQLREMIRRERNHPCVFSWGLCNEVDGQNPVAQEFVRRMLREAKRLDPGRLCSYASNSLQGTPERDVSGEMDFIEWNEYYETWYGGDPEVMRKNLEAIHRAFPGKPIVISEHGYCACTADRPENDLRRVEILKSHNAVFRDYPWVGGLIFFDYNDYRTHWGDKGLGVLKQRAHGVVDVFGARKPSFQALREESSPVESFMIRKDGGRRTAVIRTRKDFPFYTLRGYKLRWTVYGNGGIPLERGETALPDLEPGRGLELPLEVREKDVRRLRIDILRPTGFSAATVFD